jgi:hypothetical protein
MSEVLKCSGLKKVTTYEIQNNLLFSRCQSQVDAQCSDMTAHLAKLRVL